MLLIVDTTTRGPLWEIAFPGEALCVADGEAVEVRGNDIVLMHLSDLRASLGGEQVVEGVVSNPVIRRFRNSVIAAKSPPLLVVYSGVRHGAASVRGIMHRVVTEYFPDFPTERATFLPCVVERDVSSERLRDLVQRFVPRRSGDDCAAGSVCPLTTQNLEFEIAFSVLLDACGAETELPKSENQGSKASYWFEPFGLAPSESAALKVAKLGQLELQAEIARFLVERVTAPPSPEQLKYIRSRLRIGTRPPDEIPAELLNGVVFGDGWFARALAQVLHARRIGWSAGDNRWKPTARSRVPIRTPAIVVLPRSAGIGLALRQYRAAWNSNHHDDCKSAIVCLNEDLVAALAGRDVFGRIGESHDRFSDWSTRIALVGAQQGLAALLSILRANRHFLSTTWMEFAHRADIVPKLIASLVARDTHCLCEVASEARRVDWVALLDDHTLGRRASVWLETVTPDVTPYWPEADAVFGRLK